MIRYTLLLCMLSGAFGFFACTQKGKEIIIGEDCKGESLLWHYTAKNTNSLLILCQQVRENHPTPKMLDDVIDHLCTAQPTYSGWTHNLYVQNLQRFILTNGLHKKSKSDVIAFLEEKTRNRPDPFPRIPVLIAGIIASLLLLIAFKKIFTGKTPDASSTATKLSHQLVIELLENGETEAAIEKANISLIDKTLLKSRFKSVERKVIRGLLTNEEAEVAYAKIRQSLMKLIHIN